MKVQIRSASLAKGVLAIITEADGTQVRVRVQPRATMPPSWRCDAHPSKDGRTTCPHIDALAATPAPRSLSNTTSTTQRTEKP